MAEEQKNTQPEGGEPQGDSKGQQDQTGTQPPASVDPPSGFTVPDGYELVEKGFKEKASRYEQQAKGSQKLYETLREAGMEDPETIKEVGRTFRTLRERGVDTKALEAAFVQEQRDQADKGGEINPDRLMADMEKRLENRFQERDLQQQARQSQEIANELAAKLAPEDAPDELRGILKDAFMQRYMDAQRKSLFPEDHPLHELYNKPLGRKELEEVFEKTKSDVAPLLGSNGMAIAKSKPSTPAGQRGTAGKEKDDESNLSPREKAKRDRQRALDKAIAGAGSAGQTTSTVAQ